MRMQMPGGDRYMQVKEQVGRHGLHTICTSGNCPNIGECWAAGTATFMILGEICTRACKFCAVKTGKPLPVDEEEATRLANTIRTMGIKHAVITSVDRDDIERTVRRAYRQMDAESDFDYVLHPEGHLLRWDLAESFLRGHLGG